MDELLCLFLDLVLCHRVVALHEPGLLLVLLPERARMLLIVRTHVLLVLLLDDVEVALASLQARELLERDERLAHRRVEEAV